MNWWGKNRAEGDCPCGTHQVFASRLVATGSCLLWGCLQGTIQSLKLTDSLFFFFLKHCFPSRLWTPQGQRVNLFCSLSRPKHSSLLDTWQGCPEVMVMVITEVMTFPYSDFWNNFRVPLLILFHSTVLAPKLAFVWILQLLFSFHSFLSHHS